MYNDDDDDDDYFPQNSDQKNLQDYFVIFFVSGLAVTMHIVHLIINWMF